jgi:23S rRNA (cytidine1920-2'-O)/16S rRNA (cytidine1409-2'-O)-methyltransferase
VSRPAPKPRVDELLVQRGLAPDLKKARALIMAGQVIARDRRVDKAGERVKPDTPLRVKTRKSHGYVSRGGVKLAGALDHFQVDPAGWIAIDLGASTGGFTDCLLQRGAHRIYAVDVGYGLLDWRLQQDARVVNLERTHAAELTEALIPEAVDLVVADISFNALGRIVGPALERLSPGGRVLLLVKPQFEVDRAAVGEGGIVRDPAAWTEACDRVSAAVQALGIRVDGIVRSSITGTQGNVEFMLAGTCAEVS